MALHEGIDPINGDFTGKDIVSIEQFTREDVDIVMGEAESMATDVLTNGRSNLLEDKIVANLFYEPSTRTYLSFEAAAKRLGAATISSQGVEYSSIAKGETLEDTIRTVERLADVIDMRHPQKGSAVAAALAARKPILNGGDGIGEHPTQALLDLFTIQEQAVRPPEDLSVTLLGDLKHGRTVHSLARLLSLFEGARLNFVSPEELRMPREMMQELGAKGVQLSEHTDLDEVLPHTDVLYVTRVQKERFQDVAAYERLKHRYIIDTEVMGRAPNEMILMHPLPRVGEITAEVDSDPRAVYFDQVENGMYVRMALLALVCGRSINDNAGDVGTERQRAQAQA